MANFGLNQGVNLLEQFGDQLKFVDAYAISASDSAANFGLKQGVNLLEQFGDQLGFGDVADNFALAEDDTSVVQISGTAANFFDTGGHFGFE